MNLKKITIVIPCHNEEKGIAKVLSDIPHKKLQSLGYTVHTIVADNNSTDRTAAAARNLNAEVVFVPKKGKGHALKHGLLAIPKDSDYVVMLDGDNTYKSSEIYRLIEPLENNFADCIIGSRLGGKIRDGAFKFQNRVANWIYTFLIRQIYRANVTDVLSGYFAWKKEVVDELLPHIQSRGFSIEIDLITKTVLLGKTIYSVPITYDQREGESKIDSIRDGLIILSILFLNIIWKPNLHHSRRQILLHAIRQPLTTIRHFFERIGIYQKNSKVL